jgi:hypothetical protein
VTGCLVGPADVFLTLLLGFILGLLVALPTTPDTQDEDL